MKLLLVGNPNVGKSVVFSRLTSVDVITSNYAGTTVEFTRGTMKLADRTVDLIDTPGTYSLEPNSKVEELTSEMINSADIIINVLDATHLERNLYLTLELLERNIPMIIALNLWDDAQHHGIRIDLEKLTKSLGVPVIPTIAVTGEGIKELVSQVETACTPHIHKHTPDERWKDIGHIIRDAQTITPRHHTLGERLADATIRPLTGLPLALSIIALTFTVVRLIGEGLISFVFDPLFDHYTPFVTALSKWIGPGMLHDLIIGKLIGGKIEYMQSMGVMTTGLYVPFAAVLPYIISFYFMLSLLEDSGYLPRLATLMDNIFHRLGMHGHGIIPVFLGLGCNVPGALATRTLETRKQRFIAATLMAISVPCMAQSAMIFGVLGPHGMRYICIVFLTLITVYVSGGLLLNRFTGGECPEIFLEVPPYRRPRMRTLAKKTFIRVKWFLLEAVPWLFFGILLINLLHITGTITVLGTIFAPLMESLLGLPREAIAVLLIGFLRKDLAVGMLMPLGLTAEQLVIATVVLTIYFPCAATFAVLLKELGAKDMIKSAAIMLFTSVLVGGMLRILLIGI